jgi:hypothetical protein
MVVYGINFSEQMENRREKFLNTTVATSIVGTTAFAGAGLWNVLGSVILAPATGGASLV